MTVSGPLLVDPEVARSGPEQREIVEVAVGVLVDAQGRFLMATRPAGKAYAGYWEFPGGKVERGETVAMALARELQEELGLTPVTQEAWREQVVDYPHALVRLHFVKVRAWRGEPEMREGQAASWQSLPVSVEPVLPGALPVLAWLEQEQQQPPEPA